LLLKVFTQNIDGLERLVGVPGELLVEAHGSFATQRCIDCNSVYPGNLMRDAIREGKVPYCANCCGLVKPDIVFFGEPLPESFMENCALPKEADLCIIMGTSLSVQPFAGLPSLCKPGTPRILINRERVGEMGSRPDDVLVLEDCDDGVRKLAHALGWERDLEVSWKGARSRHNTVKTGSSSAPEEESLEGEISQLTMALDKRLGISND
jgi:NAD-dependent histone deacetylase SIR2